MWVAPWMFLVVALIFSGCTRISGSAGGFIISLSGPFLPGNLGAERIADVHSKIMATLRCLEGGKMLSLAPSSCVRRSPELKGSPLRLDSLRHDGKHERRHRQPMKCAGLSIRNSQDETERRIHCRKKIDPLSDLKPLKRVDLNEHGRDGCPQGQENMNAETSGSSQVPVTLFSAAPMLVYPLIADGGYSLASYYTSLGLFIISVPGIWSLVKRSTKSKIVKKTFAMPGPSVADGKAPTQIAGEITSSLNRNNFTVSDRGETVTFEGLMIPSRSQAAFLSFCTAVSLGCVALVLSITLPDVGSNWYYLTVFSPLAGFYYWTRAARKEEIKVKMVIADDESSTDVIIQGDDEQIDRLRRELGLMEKGMIYVKGVLE